MKRFTVLLFMLTIILRLAAEEIGLWHVDTPDGLTANTINSTLRSRQGYLWAGTPEGLVRFDGYTCRLFPLPSHPGRDGSAGELVEDSRGTLWVHAGEEWLSFSPSEGRFTAQGPDAFASAGMAGAPRHIGKDLDNGLWIFTSADSIYHIPSVSAAPRPVTFGSFPSLKGKRITAFVRAERYMTAVTDRGELYDISPITHRVEWYDSHIPSVTEGKAGQNYRLLYDREGLLWIYGEGNLWLFDSNRRLWLENLLPEEMHRANVRAMIQDSEGHIWMARDHHGLEQVERRGGRYSLSRRGLGEPGVNPDATITTFNEDRNGTIWIGTKKHGLFFSDEVSRRFMLSRGYDTEVILPATDGTIWLGTESNGVAKWDQATDSYTYYNITGDETAPVTEILRVDDGTIYASLASGGLWKVANGQLSPVPVISDTTVITAMSTITGESILLATDEGDIYVYEPKDGSCKELKVASYLPSRPVAMMTEAADGKVYLATQSGVGVLWPGFRKASVLKGPWKSPVNSVHADRKGTLWIATAEGIDTYQPAGGEYRRLFTADSLGIGEPATLREGPDGSIWAAGRKGLARIKTGRDSTITLNIYNAGAGLPSGFLNPRALAIAKDGTVFAGSVHGVSRLFPNTPFIPHSAPGILFPTFTAGGQELKRGTRDGLTAVSIRTTDRDIRITVAPDNPAVAPTTRYSYLLDGYGNNPVMLPEGENVIRLTSLPAGSYRLIVNAFGPDGTAGRPGMLDIRVTKPFYFSNFAIVLYLLILICAGWWVVSLLHRRRSIEALSTAEPPAPIEIPVETPDVAEVVEPSAPVIPTPPDPEPTEEAEESPETESEPEAEPETEPEIELETAPATPARTPQPLVLIVDSDISGLQALSDSLSHHFRVFTATDGEASLTLLRSAMPAAVITGLPTDSEGFDCLCKGMKGDPERERTPLLALTDSYDDSTRMKILMAGVDDYIIRPADGETVVTQINRLIALRTVSASSPLVTPEVHEETIPQADKELVEESMRRILDNMHRPDFSVEELSGALGMSRVHLYKKLKALTGKTPIEFIRAIRLKCAAMALLRGTVSVSEVASQVGFNSPKYFARYFKEEFSILPSEYRDYKGKCSPEV